MRILIINQPLRNHGDEAAHRAFIHALHRAFPDGRIRILFVNEKKEDIEAFGIPEEAGHVRIDSATDRLFYKVTAGAILRGIPSCRPLWSLSPACRSIMAEYRQADIIVCAPGGTCLGIQQNWLHLILLDMAVSMKKKVAYWGRSIGPFPEDSESRKRFKACAVKCLRGCGFVALRDRFSMETAAEFGIQAVEITDSAFLELPVSRDLPAEFSPLTGKDRYCVFIPNVLRSMAGFRELPASRTCAFFKKVLDIILEGFDGRVVMLPQLFGQGEWNDEPFFRQLADGNDRVTVIPDSCPSDIQQSIISGAAFLVGARYHSMVFAINTGTPFIAFSYEHKISGLLRILGLEDRMTDLQKGAFESPSSEEAALEAFREKFGSIGTLSTVSREGAAALAGKGFRELVNYIRETCRE